MGGLIRDLRYGFRVVVARPVFTVAVVVTLALGIGLNAATFSAVHGILLRPLDGAREPERLVQIYRSWAGIEYGSVSVPHYQDVRDRSSEVFESTAAWSFNSLSLSSGDRSERLLGLLVSANFFQTYGVAPALGRVFIPGVESVGPGAHPVAVLGYSFWSSRFGGDPSVVGRTVILNGHPFEIVGVAAEGFGGPMSVVDVPVYVPLMMQAQIVPGFDVLESRGNNFMSAVGRLRPGASIDQAQAFMDAMLLQLRDEYPDDYDRQLGTALVLQTDAGIHPSFGSAQRGMSAVMLAVVGVLLLIACVNVANLFLVRARERRREMGIRLSLGAGTGRIVRQLLTESLLFSLLGGAAGLGLAYVVVTLLARIRPPIDGPWRFNVDLDGTVLLFTLGITVVAGVLFGLAPALQAASPDTVSAIKGDADGPRRSRISRALILAQISLSIVLLISSGLFLRSLQGATRIDPGFRDPATIVTAGVDPALQGYDRARIREFFDRLVEEVARIPGVTAVGLSNDLPLDFSNSSRGVEIAGYDFAEDEQKSLGFSVVSEGYLEAMGIDILEGRSFRRTDDEGSVPVMVINRHMAERFWPGESALGKVVRTGGQDREVVGVVVTGRYQSLGEAPADFMFLPHRQEFRNDMAVVARVSGDTGGALARIRRIVGELDADMPVYDVRTVEDLMGLVLLPARLGAFVLGGFGLLGLLLAAVGVYGVMAYSVSQRTREMGIRLSLGAGGREIVRLVLADGMRLALLGSVIGLVMAFFTARAMGSLLYDVDAIDPVAFTLVPTLLLGVAAVAVYLPARRAGSVDPIRALKA